MDIKSVEESVGFWRSLTSKQIAYIIVLIAAAGGTGWFLEHRVEAYQDEMDKRYAKQVRLEETVNKLAIAQDLLTNVLIEISTLNTVLINDNSELKTKYESAKRKSEEAIALAKRVTEGRAGAEANKQLGQ